MHISNIYIYSNISKESLLRSMIEKNNVERVFLSIIRWELVYSVKLFRYVPCIRA